MLQFPLEQELLLKYQTLSTPLREALESRYNLKHIRAIAGKHSLTQEDTEAVVQLVGLSLTGFLNPNDLNKELFEYLELRDKKTIDALAEELTQEILMPLKRELQNLYRSPDLFSKPTKEPVAEPKATMRETKETLPLAAETIKQTEEPVPIKKEGAGAGAAGPVPAPLETRRAAPEAAPAPASTAAVPPPTTRAPELVMPLRPAEPAPAKIHPFALGETPTRPAAPVAPAPAPAAPTPFILHKEEAPVPILESKQVQIQRDAAPRPETSRPTVVRLEMAGEEEKKKKGDLVAKTEIPQQRVVHYSSFRTPINPFGPGGEVAAPSAVPAQQARSAATQAEAPKAIARELPAAQPQIAPPPKEQEEVIDLVTFQRAQKAEARMQPSVATEGNTVDLRGSAQ